MTNKRFISVLMTMFLLLTAVFGSAGCGGGGSSNSTDNEANNPIQRPEQDKTPAPEPTPEPTPSGYVVSFESNGGSTVVSIHVSSGSTVEMPEIPTKTSYVFAGWYRDEDFTEMFTFGADGDKVTQNITLYAQWIKLDT